MSLTPSVLYTGGRLATSPGILVTGAVNARTIVTQAVFTNVDTVSRLLTVYLVRAGASAGASNILIDALPLAAGQAYPSPEMAGQVLGPSDTIQAKADAGAVVNCTGVSGYVQS